MLALFGSLVISGIVFVGFYDRSSISKRAMMEVNVIDGINKVELTKIALEQSLKNSFYQASYLVSEQGGYYDLIDVDSYDCIPYWRVYDDATLPDYENNLEQTTLHFFNKYADSFEGEADIPDYNSVSVEKVSGKTKVKASSDEQLKLSRPMVEVSDNSELTTEVKLRTLRLFQIGKENFVDNDLLGEQIKGSTTYEEVLTRISGLQSELNDDEFGYGIENVEIELKPTVTVGLDGSLAARVLVMMTDNSGEYVAYDYSSQKTEMKKIVLKFYLLVGEHVITPEINECEIKEEIIEVTTTTTTTIPVGGDGDLISCPDSVTRYMDDYSTYRDTIVSAIQEAGLTDLMPMEKAINLVAAIITQESGWNQDTGCSEIIGCGMMQITKSSAGGCTDLGGWDGIKTDANKNIRCGVRILKSKLRFMQKFNDYDEENLIKITFAAYNGGQGTIQRAIENAEDSKWEIFGTLDNLARACEEKSIESGNEWLLWFNPDARTDCRENGFNGYECKALIIQIYVDHVYGYYEDWMSCEREESTEPPEVIECGTVGIPGCPSNQCLLDKPDKNGIDYPPCNNKIKITATNPANSESCDSPRCMYEFTHDLNEPYLDVYDSQESVREDLKSEIENQLEYIEFLGCTVRVHKKVTRLFRDIEQELNAYNIPETQNTYNFPSGEYTFDCPHTGAYVFRSNVNNPSVLGSHSFGIAIDINWQQNWGNVLVPMACMIDMPPEVVESFENKGFRWGGRFWPSFDPMHFEYIPSCIV